MSSRINPLLVTDAGERNAQRIKALAKKKGILGNKLAERFCLEGAIRRIFQSDFADRFGMTAGLKGGTLMFFSEGVDPIDGRSTGDIDIQINGFAGTMDEFVVIMRQVLATIPVIDDGVRFDLDKLQVKSVKEGGVPGGSITTKAQVGGMDATFKVDVGFYAPDFADTLVETDYPSLLPTVMPPIRIYRQPVAYAISDKVHAAVRHSGTNTRMRDYYDIYVMLTHCQVSEQQLSAAFARSWPIYGDPVPTSIDDLKSYGDAFALENAKVWQAVRAKAPWAVPAPELIDIVRLIRDRLRPVLEATPAPRAAA